MPFYHRGRISYTFIVIYIYACILFKCDTLLSFRRIYTYNVGMNVFSPFHIILLRTSFGYYRFETPRLTIRRYSFRKKRQRPRLTEFLASLDRRFRASFAVEPMRTICREYVSTGFSPLLCVGTTRIIDKYPLKLLPRTTRRVRKCNIILSTIIAVDVAI